MSKPVSPYVRLRDVAKEFARKVKYPRRVGMFTFAKESLDSRQAWRLDGTYERALAAQACGYEVHIVADDVGMRFEYVAKRPDTPHELA